jgi:surface antigen
MRWTSWVAPFVIAIACSLLWQPAANSAAADQADDPWTADAILDASSEADAMHAKLTPDDPVAVLEAIDFALKEVADGATYVWHRTDGVLRGTIRPFASFRDPSGDICRHMSLTVAVGAASRWTEATACREATGRWVIGG